MPRKIKVTSDQRPFVMTYWDFIESNLFDWNEKRIFIILKKFADKNNQCFPSIKTLCDLSQLSRNTVKKTLKSLEEKKVITIEHRNDKENNRSQSHLYTLYDYKELWNAESIEQIKETVDIEELQLFELAKKKGYILTKEKEPTSEPTKVTDVSTHLNKTNQPDNTIESQKSQDSERYTLGQIKELFGYEVMILDYPDEQEYIDSVMDILHTTVNTDRKTIRISGTDKPTMVVVGKLMKLNNESILYAIRKFKGQTERIKNPTAYMLAILYAAPEQYKLDIANQVQHDLF